MTMEIPTQIIRLDRIKRGKRFRKSFGDIPSLAKSISEHGLMHPLVLDKDLNLVAGERRFAALLMLGHQEAPCRILSISNTLRAELDENMQRLNFAPSEAAEIMQAISGGKRIGRPAAEPTPDKTDNLSQLPEGSAREIAAAATGYSEGTLNKIQHIQEAAEKEPEKFSQILEKVDSGEMSIDKAHNEVRGKSSSKATKVKQTTLHDFMEIVTLAIATGCNCEPCQRLKKIGSG